MKSEDLRVVVCGRNYGNLLAMARDLGEAGYDVEMLRLYKKQPSRLKPLNCMKPERYSKYVKVYTECIVNNDYARVVNSLIPVGNPEKKLLIPTDDYSAAIVDLYLGQLREYYFLPHILDKPGEIVRLMDKCEQKLLAENFGLPVLYSELIRCEQGKFDISDTVKYPCFIKPNISINSTKARMCKCKDRDELNSILSEYAQSGDFDILVEEFADIKTEYSILGLSVDGKAIAPGLFKVINSGHNERKGVAMTGEILRTDELQKFINQCSDFIEQLHYTGLFDIDLLETKEGKLFFVEVNFRAGASTRALTQCGINLPSMYADNLLKGISIDRNPQIVDGGKKFISEKILLEEYARNNISYAKAKQLTNAMDIYFIRDYKDIKPYAYFKRFVLIAGLLRPLYRLKDNKRNNERSRYV